MGDPAKILTAFGILLLICAAFAGCSNNSGQAQATASATTAAGESGTPMFTAGDIVGSSSGSSSTAFLIIGYDSGSDTYTRAFIHKNTDGSWGYRTNAETQTIDRASMERLYSKVLGHVSVSSIPTSAPTIVTTATVTTSATSAQVTTTATTTTNTSSTSAPRIKSIDPEEEYAGDTVSMTITGSNFKDGATVALTKSGEDNIVATDVTVSSSSQLTCTFDIPDTASVGTWSVKVTNSDGKSGELTNWFIIHAVKITNPTVTSISPTSGYQGDDITMTITGTKFSNGATVALTKSSQSEIDATDVTVSSSTKITATFTIPSGAAAGTWAVVVTNTGDLSGKLTAAFTIYKSS